VTSDVRLSSTNLIFVSSSNTAAPVKNTDFDTCMRETVFVVSPDAGTWMASVLEQIGDVIPVVLSAWIRQQLDNCFQTKSCMAGMVYEQFELPE